MSSAGSGSENRRFRLQSKMFQFAIDRGGTFTDIWARCRNGKTRVIKLLSEDPANYSDAPREGIRRILEEELGTAFPPVEPLDTSNIEWIRMGTTVATNSLLERKGEKMALVITKGFKDVLYIGNQARPKIFDLEIVTTEMLYEAVIEVEERVVLQQKKCQLKKSCPVVTGSTDENVEIWEEINKQKLSEDLQKVYDIGIRSLAIVLIHSYTFANHELEVGALAKKIGFTHVSLSHQVMPMVRIVPRGFTACADAYLTPCIQKYVHSFSAGFKDLSNVRVLFMQSDGGLTPVQKFSGSRAILSGPAGGVVGYAMTTYNEKTRQPVIGFDMGGTSTDVSRYAGIYEHVFETSTAGVSIQAPQLDINTVAAGGGSKLFFRSGMFVVGPESAGAHPGPVCYKKGGPLAVTDANLVLGRLLPDYFPKIFGASENEALDSEATKAAFTLLTQQVNDFNKEQSGIDNSKPFQKMSVEQVAMGFIRVANESMCRPIRALTQAKGYDTSRHVLACFGGAGGQHACAIARSLGMKTVFIHKYAGILSAYGMALADVVHEAQVPAATVYSKKNFSHLDSQLEALEKQCSDELQSQGFQRSAIETEAFLHLRYQGTDCALMCSAAGFPKTDNTCCHGDFQQAFIERYQSEFGFTIADRDIVVDDLRVRGVGKSRVQHEEKLKEATEPPHVEKVTDIYFEDGFQSTNVYLLEKLQANHFIDGPAIIIDKNSTILIEPNCEGLITAEGDVQITVGTGKHRKIGPELDMIQLSIFSHRFMSTAEQMGRVLQRTSISTNIKERLDFSCAMFGPDGGLVANAPHIPVHLGAMQETVKYQLEHVGSKLCDGDVILSNHPCAGGSHLPDLTVITPVFYGNQPKPVFFVASRGHHADIGGITPGSMPPNSQSIFEEGAVFKSFYLLSKHQFQEKAVIEALNAPGNYPGSSPTRNLHDNLSDLRAQVAANQKGINLITELIDEYGLDVVQAYMAHIQKNAEVAVKEMLQQIAKQTRERTGATRLLASDFMDDGSEIVLQVDINEEKGTAVFDFTGTGTEVLGNCNAPKAVTLSAVIYCLRCMVGYDVPLNKGCLTPVSIIIPKGCMLDPSDTAAVVGGNVLTSQRVVDVILKAFGVCAASQGCMNNVTFGDEDIGYYETIAGGAGAGPTWDGRSGVHSHMTNTRITDPEILERRYPIVLKSFSLKSKTGGQGEYYGGNGCIRELLFRKDLVLSVLTERRVYQPYALKGGQPGKCGKNLLCRRDGRVINLGGKASVNVEAGDLFQIQTPGGGGYGPISETSIQTPDGGRYGPISETSLTVDSDLSYKHRRSNKGSNSMFVQSGSVREYLLKQESA